MSALGGRVAPEIGTEELVAWFREAHARDPGVLGLGFGPPTRRGHLQDALAVVVLVREKRPVGSVDAVVPETLWGLPTDVIDQAPPAPPPGRVLPAEDRRRRGGGRVHVDTRPWGTLAARLTLEDGTAGVLANAHVVVPAGQLVDPDAPPVVRRPVSPRVFDDQPWSRSRAPLGTVERFVPLLPLDRGHNEVDAAVVRVDDPGSVVSGVAGLGPVGKAREAASVRPGLPVHKVGDGSGAICSGVVRLTRALYLLRTGDYGVSGAGTHFLFVEQIIASVHQVGGDSGSLLLADDGGVVGLLHARHPRGWGVASPAERVEGLLGVQFGQG